MTTLEQCREYAERAGLRVTTQQDRKRDGTYVDVWIVYRLAERQGKSRTPDGLMRLLKKTMPVKHVEPEVPLEAQAPVPPRRARSLAPIKPWWEED